MSRDIRDALLEVTQAMPAAGATANSSSIDLTSTTLGSANEATEFVIDVPATPSLANTETLTFTVQDSANNSSFAAISDVDALVLTGDGGDGADAYVFRTRLPEATRRYVRVSIVASASAGDNTGITATIGLRG